MNVDSFNDGRWHHLACSLRTSGNKSLTIYLNGYNISYLEPGIISIEPGISETTIGGMGGAEEGVGKFAGSIDEVRLYQGNKTLSVAEILQINQSGRIANVSLISAGLELWYSLNEGTGGNIFDKTLFARDGESTEPQWADNNVTINLTVNTDYLLGINTFQVKNPVYIYNLLNVSYSFVTEEGEFSAIGKDINKSLVGLGGFADFVPIIVIALAASIIIGLILVGFAFTRRQR